MKEQFKIADIITKCIQEKELSADEMQYIGNWRKQSNNNNTYKELLNGNGLEVFQQGIKKYDSNAALQNVLRKSSASRFNRVRLSFQKIAAVVIPAIIILGASFLLWDSTPEQTTIAKSEEIKPVSNKAILLLDNGQSVQLGDIEQGVISESDGTLISNDKGLIKYDQSNKIAQKTIYNTIKVPRGGEYQLVLADGTKVWLNSDSEIKYPVQFTGNTREVWISGELYFDVHPDKNKPFKISANGVGIEVLGTEFNVEAYKEDQDIITTLIEGSVKVTTESNKGLIMKPNDQVVFNRTDQSIEINQVNARNMSLWKDGVFYADAEPLSEIMERLARWYNVDVSYDSPMLKTKRFSIEVKRYEDISKVLHILAATQKVDFDVEGNKVIVMK
ncbi:FecR family protein [Saccharicrinis aurantiacus]|uniref:FecR family protein n=1 Tax=Saccharicrinis aurantiacus TaxID=1849719 RepID=UPI00094F8207|nr:FecR domain-containing protein [Saccharicrinis aurantiacus]